MPSSPKTLNYIARDGGVHQDLALGEFVVLRIIDENPFITDKRIAALSGEMVERCIKEGRFTWEEFEAEKKRLKELKERANE